MLEEMGRTIAYEATRRFGADAIAVIHAGALTPENNPELELLIKTFNHVAGGAAILMLLNIGYQKIFERNPRLDARPLLASGVVGGLLGLAFGYLEATRP